MNSFNIFLKEEQEKPSWFEKVPMPTMVGNALMVAGQFSHNFKNSLQESYGDVHQGRGFPLSKSATDMLSIVPIGVKASTAGKQNKKGEYKNLGPMVHAFDWLVNRGLFEALQIRKRLADQATKELISELGEEEFRQLVRGDAVTEDMVYSKKAHEAIQPLAQWFEGIDPSQLEPASMIKFPVGKNYQRVSLSDINEVIKMLNGQMSGISLEQFYYGGPKGFIEWIEDGPWAEKIGTIDQKQPWRTKHGISLHDSKVAKDPETGQLAYQFGGVITPLRDLGGSYQKKMRGYVQQVVAETAQAVKGQVDIDKLSNEERERFEQIMQVYGGNNVIEFNFGSFSAARGYDQSWPSRKERGFEKENASDYAAHVLMLRAAIDMRAEINDALDGGVSEEQILKDYNISQKELSQIRNKNSQINSSNKNDYYKKFGVEQGKDHWKTGTANVKNGTVNLRASSMLNFGYTFLKNMIANGKSLPGIVQKYLGEDIQSGKLGEVNVAEIIKAVNHIANEAGTSSIPKLGLGPENDQPVNLKNASFGDVLRKEQPISDDQIQDLIDKGYQFMGSIGEPDNVEKAKAGKLTNADKTIVLRRNSENEPWKAMAIDDDPGEPKKGYSADVPFLMPSRKMRYGGGSYIGNQAGKANNQSGTMKDVENNPQNWGYGIGSMPSSMFDHMKQIARSMIMSGRQGNKFDVPFAEKTPDDLAYSLISYALEKLSGPVFKYGDLSDARHLSDIQNQLMSDKEGLPGLSSQEANDWISRAIEGINSGKVQDIPQEIMNAFLIGGAHYRGAIARKTLRSVEELDKAGQFAQMKGKEGDTKSLEGEISNSNDRETGFVKGGVANTMRNRLGVDKNLGITGGEEVELGSAEGVTETPIRSARNMEGDDKYIIFYRRTSEKLSDDVKDLIYTLRSIPKGTINSAILGQLDAVGDKMLQIMSQKHGKTAEENNPLVELMKNVGLTLDTMYQSVDDKIDLTSLLKDALGPSYMYVTQMAKKLHAEDLEFLKQKGQQQQFSTAGAQVPDVVKPAARQPEAEVAPATSPNLKPAPEGGGLRSFIRRKQNESYSFRTRTLRKLAEMAGGDAVGTGEKFTGNWWGAIGDPLGVSIDGEVEDRQSNPDGTKGKKRGRKKSK